MRVFKHSLLLVILIITSFNSIAALPNNINGKALPTLAPLIKKVSPAVVDISVFGESTATPGVPNELLEFLQPQRPPQQFSGLGSGVIIDAQQGYIITNYHVIENADDIVISLTSGHQYKATVIGQDPQSDIALLQIKSKQPLVAITFANSDQLQVGDFTIAIGNPFGLGQTVTSGIVSALGRSGLNLQNLENYIQTDAAINSGNSGGALLNLNGELIGINTAILGPNGGNIGIAFAIPSNMVKNLTQQLLEFGEIRRGILGIKGGEVTPDLAKSFSLDVTKGAFIYQVTPDSAADKAGLKAGDVITAINGTAIKSFAALRAKIGTLSSGKKVSLSVIQDNKYKNINVILGGNTTTAKAKLTPILPVIFEGAILKDIAPGQSVAGVNVVEVKPNSMASRIGLLENDKIIAVNKTAISNQAELISALEQAKNMRALNIMRNNRLIYIILD
ncbi:MULTISPECIES: DegQ family serine endoprotease [Psychromonas]|uniref:DegQ family serine endoprotease n=1 Tax=Psychromonas TaxID=67572 RepID=UPI000414C11D|nr:MULTISPECIES: DegQ family serine endoprotease [Psychromonas]MBB1271560.1 DegQ family serine endoprotease [Psychromonas sp. SR45-3]